MSVAYPGLLVAVEHHDAEARAPAFALLVPVRHGRLGHDDHERTCACVVCVLYVCCMCVLCVCVRVRVSVTADAAVLFQVGQQRQRLQRLAQALIECT